MKIRVGYTVSIGGPEYGGDSDEGTIALKDLLGPRLQGCLRTPYLAQEAWAPHTSVSN